MALTLSGTNGVVGAGFTLDASGASVTAGIGTFSSISAGCSFTAAGLTGALPTISAANCTNIPAANITGTLPAISGANLTGLSAGITNSDIWRNTTSHQGNTDKLANWERPDTGQQGYLGTGMSNSSGTFTFPSTGIWHIQYFAQLYIDNTTSASQRSSIGIMVTTNNSSYTVAAQGHVHWGGGGYSTSISTLGSCTASMLFDCTDVSQQKLQFRFGAGQGFEYIRGDSSYNETYVIFTRHGDT